MYILKGTDIKSDSSTKCWNEIGSEWIEKAQTNDFRMFYIMPNTFELLGNVNQKNVNSCKIFVIKRKNIIRFINHCEWAGQIF